MGDATCKWRENPEDGLYEPGCGAEEWHLPPGLDLYEFCPHCGKRIEVTSNDIGDNQR